MQTLHLEDGQTALVIVAHPDDETIWLGGTIMKNPQVKWAVFTLCRSTDADREPKFQKVCQYYGAEAIITDLDDEGQLSIEQTIPIIKDLITSKIKQPVDYLFFHGPNGEYGHPRHIGVYQAIKEMLDNKQLLAESAFYFNYQKDDPNAEFSTISIKQDTNYITQLSPEQLAEKKRIVAEMYGYPADGPDVSYCTNPEGFKKIKK